MAEASLWLLVLLPAGVGAVLAISPRLERAAAPLAIGAAAATLVLSVVVAIERPAVSLPFMAGGDFGMGVDALSALVVPTVAVVTMLVLVYASGESGESRGRFHGLMLLFAAAALTTSTATTLPALLVAWEVMGATSYALIGFWWRDERRVSSGLTAFLTTRTADLGLYAAAAAALAGGAGLGLADLSQSSEGWRHVIALGVLVAALGKAAQLPFSFWLARAMDGPSPVSALLHSAAMVAMGGYLLLRTEPLLASTGWASPAAAWAGALTALLLGVVAVAQSDLKQLLAASTSAQLGFVVLAAGLGSISGGAAHLIAHAATKALLFLAAGAWLNALGTKQLQGLQGVARRWRVVGWSATLGALSLAGLAPLSLWATKDAIVSAAREESWGLYAVAIAASVLSAAYAGKILFVVWRRVPASAESAGDGQLDERRTTSDVSWLGQAPLVVLAAGAAVLGFLALPPVGDAVARAVGAGAGGQTPLLELIGSAVLALLVLLAVWRWGVPEPRWAQEWLSLERAAHALVVRPTLRLADALARFDDKIIDGSVRTVSAASIRMADRAAAADNDWLDGGVEWIATQMGRLGQLARRPQTGQLHHYYIQAVAVLAIGALLLVTVR